MFDVKLTRRNLDRLMNTSAIIAGPFNDEANAIAYKDSVLVKNDDDPDSVYEVVPHVESGTKDKSGAVLKDVAVDVIDFTKGVVSNG